MKKENFTNLSPHFIKAYFVEHATNQGVRELHYINILGGALIFKVYLLKHFLMDLILSC